MEESLDNLEKIIEVNIEEITKQEVRDIIKKEIEIVSGNFDIVNLIGQKSTFNNSTIVMILDSYFKTPETVPDLFHTLNKHKDIVSINQKEDDFPLQFYIKFLFIRKYIRFPKVFTTSQSNSEEMWKVFITNGKFESALEKLYINFPELFDIKNYDVTNENLSYYIEMHNSSSSDTFDLIKNYGSLLNFISSEDGFSILEDAGLQLIGMKGYLDSIRLQNSQKESIEEIKGIKNDFNNNNNKLIQIKNDFNDIVYKQNKKNIELDSKLNGFYNNIITILSILVGAFAIIGVNINSIPKINNDFTINVITMNFSLILCLLIFFLIVKIFTFNFDEIRLKENNEIEVKIDKLKAYFNKLLIGITAVSILFLCVAFFYGVVKENNELKVTKDIINDISKDNLLIKKAEYERMKEKINEIDKLDQKIDKLEDR